MSNAQITRESLLLINEAKAPRTLSEAYRLLGGKGKLSGTTAKKMRELVPGIEAILAKNKAKASESKAEGSVEPPKEKRLQKADKKSAKALKKSAVPRHPKNPFRPGSGYGLLLDLIANAGSKGIGKEDLLKAYCKAAGKDIVHAKYDLAVINSAREDSDKRHRSATDGFTILKDGENYRVRFQ